MSSMGKLLGLMMSLLQLYQSSQGSVLQYTAGTVAIDLPYTQEWMLHIYPSIRMNLSGQVFAFEFFANNTGKVFFSVWDVVNATTFRLHRKTNILVHELGKEINYLRPKKKFMVSADQVLGVHHEVNAGHIIPMAIDDCCNLQTEPAFSYNLRDSELPVGYIARGGNESRKTMAVVVHLRKTPITTITGPGSFDIFENTDFLACFFVPRNHPGMVGYHFSYSEPIPNLLIRVDLKGGPCQSVFVFWTLKVNGQEKLNRLCTLNLSEETDFTFCRFACLFDQEPGNNMISAFNLRIYHQSWFEIQLCWVDIDEV